MRTYSLRADYEIIFAEFVFIESFIKDCFLTILSAEKVIMWVLLFIELLMIALFILMGWAIKKKQAYWIISCFNTRPKEEQEQLIEKGLPQKTGTLMYVIGFGMLILLPLLLTPFKYAMEAPFTFSS